MGQPPAFPCIHCGGRTETKDSRPATYQSRQCVRRRRCCTRCGWRVTTYEVLDNTLIQADARLSTVMQSLRYAHEAIGALIAAHDSIAGEQIPDGADATAVSAHDDVDISAAHIR